MNIFNNEIFICSKIKKATIIVKNELDEEIEISKNYKSYVFYFAFCVTCHKSQGSTIDETNTIHEWKKYDRR
jgi:ATP-dependent exoDNAse (exonuclease V) alpha subunit